MEAVILAGGLGVRLRSEVADLPKVLATVRERPFIHYLLDFLCLSGVTRFVLATGYLHEAIEGSIGESWQSREVVYSRESEPLGSGGAVRLALRKVQQEHAFVLNGDTLFEVPLTAMMQRHVAIGSDVTLALKRVDAGERYGTVGLAADGRVTEFLEKRPVKKGLINGGVYAMRRSILEKSKLPDRFSLEEDFFRPFAGRIQIHGFIADAYFIDIGIPEDYRRAQDELGR